MKPKTLIAALVPLCVAFVIALPDSAEAWPPAPPSSGPCPGNPGGQPYGYTFCLLAPHGNPNSCSDRFESFVVACDYWTAVATAQSGAVSYSVWDGYCPACY